MIRNELTLENYSFENLDEMKRILQIDCISEYDIDENRKWIEYKLDRRYCIRLTDLVHQIKEDLIRFHLGQLLILVKKIIEKLNQLEQNKITHEFLELNRIWIKLSYYSQDPKIYYQKFDYDIHFTGYQCPFYEKPDNFVKPSIRVILKNLMNDCFTKIKLKQSDEKYKMAIFDNTLLRIFGALQKSFNEILLLIDSLLTTFVYDSTDQTLNVDDKLNDKVDSDRFKKMAEIYKAKQHTYELESKYSLEIREAIQNSLIPIYMKIITINTWFDCLALKMQRPSNEQYVQLFQKASLRSKNLNSALNENYKQLFDSKLKEIDLHFKFTFDKESQEIIQKEVIDTVLQSREMKYFENTYWLQDQNDIFFQQQKVQALKILDYLFIDKLNLEIQIKILQLILSLG